VPDTRSGTPGADAVKVKGAITWLAADDAVEAEVRLYERLFTDPQPDLGGKDFLSFLNGASKRVVRGLVEPSVAPLSPEDRVQLERHGYFVADRVDHRPGRPVLNRIATLRESK
jgi:glutaminyl-tRNA synthetase